MDYIVVEGVRPYDGRYEFDIAGQELTTREWGWIKRLSGYLPLTVEEGFSDPELVTVFAAIALRRAGKITVQEVPATLRAPERCALRLGDHPRDRSRGGGRGRAPSSPKLELERRHFWAQFEAELGDIASAPESLWDARLGYFSIGPAGGRRVDAGAAARLRRPLLGHARRRVDARCHSWPARAEPDVQAGAEGRAAASTAESYVPSPSPCSEARSGSPSLRFPASGRPGRRCGSGSRSGSSTSLPSRGELVTPRGGGPGSATC